MVDETLDSYYPLYDEGLYTEVVHQNGERAIKILKGEYKGIVYQYGKIEFVPRAESEIPTINFDRAIRVCSEELLNTISEDKEFNKIMGNILIELLANQGIVESDEKLYKMYDDAVQEEKEEELNHGI